MNITDYELVGIYLACKRELIKRAKDNCNLGVMSMLATGYAYEIGLLETLIGTFIYDCEDGVEIDGDTYTMGGWKWAAKSLKTR